MANKKNLENAAATATAKFFSKAPVPKEKEEAPVKKKNDNAVFSFRSDSDSIKTWRLYASIKQMPIGELGTVAMEEYLQRHPLEGAEKAFFDSKISG